MTSLVHIVLILCIIGFCVSEVLQVDPIQIQHREGGNIKDVDMYTKGKVGSFLRDLIDGDVEWYTFHEDWVIYDHKVARCKNPLIFVWEDHDLVFCDSGIFITERMIIKLSDRYKKGMDRLLNNVHNIPELLVEKLINRHGPYPLNRRLWFLNDAICSYPWFYHKETCKSSPENVDGGVECIFLHGAGQHWVPTDIVDEFYDYWGSIEKYTPQCKTRRFIRSDTRGRGWDNHELQKEYCNLIMHTPGKVVVFAHSMANLIIAAGVKNGYCNMVSSRISWYDLSGPIDGSKAANVLIDICRKVSEGYKDKVYKYIAKNGHYCKPGTNDTYEVYHTLAIDYRSIRDLHDIVDKYRKGGICGTSPIGIFGEYSVLYFLSKVVNFGDKNGDDGLVNYGSCAMNHTYKPDYKSTFYKARVNHADSTCRNGDSWFGIDKSPCLWFTNKV
jgi:hypothetical protein